MKIKLFFSYSHKDTNHRRDLETHLATLRNESLIDEWCDKKICAGEDWNQEIENNLENSHIILLLFSSDFIASNACKKEVKSALKLKREKDKIFIPIILRECGWKDIDGIKNIQALPAEGRAITKWKDKDSAWDDVRQGIKQQIEKIRDEFTPALKDRFKKELLKNPITNCTLDKLFVYPDISTNKLKKKLEDGKISSKKLINIKDFNDDYILIEGDEQSGKTSLCNMLYLEYVNADFYPVLLNGRSITGKADIKSIVNKEYENQYDTSKEYWSISKEKRILIIDDINNNSANNTNYSNFLKSIEEEFEHAIVLIDKLSNLSGKSTKHTHSSLFIDYTIEALGHKKRDELIKKCIANEEGIGYSIENQEQVAKLDKDTSHINAIIGSNIFPSYPIFVISAFDILESGNPYDMNQTSYGYCYQAMITLHLGRENVRAEDIDEHFNLLAEFAYFMFSKNGKSISQGELQEFLRQYKSDYVFDKKTFDNLIASSILMNKNETYSFQYAYIYYYFVAKYIADNFYEESVKDQMKEIISKIHKKDNSNIVIFITHHTKNKDLLDDILLHTMSIFEQYTEATLNKDETDFINKSIENLGTIKVAPNDHNPEVSRNKALEKKDTLKPIVEKIEDRIEKQDNNLLLVDITKAAKSLEIIGQIMRNQVGTFKRDQLEELFVEGQNVGLRLLKSFIELMSHANLDEFIQERITKISKEGNQSLSKERIKKISGKLVTEFSYSIIFGWIYKIVDSLGYEKLTTIADNVNQKTDTTASKLINFSIHAWHKKNIDFIKLKKLYNGFKNDKNKAAEHILKDMVVRHIYMHKINYKEKQKINDLLGFKVQEQIAVQKKLTNLPVRKIEG